MSTETGPAGVRTGTDQQSSRRLPTGLLVVGLALYAVAGVLAGLIEVTLIPLRYGTTLVPVAPVLTVLTGVLLPALGRGLTDRAGAAAPPAIGQLLTIWLLATGRPEGDVLMPAGDTAWVSYAVLILGTLVPLAVLGFASRPGRWDWPTGGRRRGGRQPATEQSATEQSATEQSATEQSATERRLARGRRRAAGRFSRARPGSDSDGGR